LILFIWDVHLLASIACTNLLEYFTDSYHRQLIEWAFAFRLLLIIARNIVSVLVFGKVSKVSVLGDVRHGLIKCSRCGGHR
jgi:hypothetical protein